MSCINTFKALLVSEVLELLNKHKNQILVYINQENKVTNISITDQNLINVQDCKFLGIKDQPGIWIHRSSLSYIQSIPIA